MMAKPKILYLAGWGRSGSTLLCRTLGEIDGWLAVGELRSVWDLGVVRNSLCGCGEEFHRCAFWVAVFDRAFGGMDAAFAKRMMGLADRLHTWHLLALPDPWIKRRVGTAMSDYVAALEQLYAAIHAVSGARVIVDSSKMPAYGYALDQLEGGELHVGHLVRDPRACAYSWMKRQKQQPFGRMKAIGPVRNSLQWVQRNQTIRRTWGRNPARYRMIRYEDFIHDPLAAVRSLAAFAGDAGADLSFLDRDAVLLGTSHMAAGNPNRFDVGQIVLRHDTQWRAGLSGRDQATVRLLSRPWLKAYGYIAG